MTRHIGAGLKSIAVANYGVKKIRDNLGPAADLQESMIDVRMSLMRSGKDAATLDRELKAVRDTAVDLQKLTPFSAMDVVRAERELLNSGLEFRDVVGKGAARAALTLATITSSSTEAATDAMLNVGIPYHLKSNQYGEVADVIQRHVMSGRMKLPDLNAALPYVAPVAKAMHEPWEDMLTGLAVLGEQGHLGSTGGTYLKDFYERLTTSSRIARRYMHAANQELIREGKAPLEFWDKHGEKLPTHRIIQNLRASIGTLNTHTKTALLQKIFGEQGGLGALGLMNEGAGSWEFIKEKMPQLASSEDKLAERLKGLNTSLTSLVGTHKTALANLFDPMLKPLTKAVQLTNELVDGVGKLAANHPKVTAAGDLLLASGVAAVGGYGLYRLGGGLAAGRRVLGKVGGLRGLLSTGLGVAEGKALEKAAGVTPVFVTNWPAGFGGGAAATAAQTAAETVAASAGASRLAKLLPWLRRGGVVAGSLAMSAPVEVIGAGMAGYAAGSYLEKRFIKGAIGEALYDFMHGEERHEPGRTPQKNDIKIDLTVDSQGRVIGRTNDLNTQVDLRKRGAFFDDALLGVPSL